MRTYTNVIYSSKIVIKSIINKVFDRVYNKTPMEDKEYPFVVYELLFVDNCPGQKLRLEIDIWNNDINNYNINLLSDRLLQKLDRIHEDNLDFHLSGEVETHGDVSTQDEDLTRYKMILNYDIYKK